MDEKVAIAKRFIGAHKTTSSKHICASGEDEFIAVYSQLINGQFGVVKATGVGSELEIMINGFDSKSGNTHLFLFTPAKEDLHLVFESAAPIAAAIAALNPATSEKSPDKPSDNPSGELGTYAF